MRMLVHCLPICITFARILPLLKLSGPERNGPHVTRGLFGVPLAFKLASLLTRATMSTLSVPRIIDVTEVLQRNFTLDTAKDCFLVYLIAKRALKLWRHVYARGVFRSLRELYVSIAQVFLISIPLTPLIETFSFALESLSAYYQAAICAQESGGGNGVCED